MKALIELYPEHMQNKTLKEILKAEQLELEQEEQAITNLVKEFFIDTATFSLAHWAKFAGIEDNYNLDLETRRSNIKAALKAQDVTTPETIKKIVESYANATCEIEEDFNNYSFTIKIVDKVGVPERIDEIKKIINKLKPAHLNYSFQFKYVTWGDTKALGISAATYKNNNKTWADIRNGEGA